jgi:hypothetical protein
LAPGGHTCSIGSALSSQSFIRLLAFYTCLQVCRLSPYCKRASLPLALTVTFDVLRQVPVENKDDSQMLCQFDGSDLPIAVGNFTVLEYRALQEVEFKTQRGPFFTETHTVSGMEIKIFKKKDRGTIVIITEGSKNSQILQIKLKEIGNDEVQAFKPALELATEIAKLYVNNGLAKDQLGTHRDKLIAEKFSALPSSEPVLAKGTGKAPKVAPKAKAPEAKGKAAGKAKGKAKGQAKGQTPGKETAAAKAIAVAGKSAMAARPATPAASPAASPAVSSAVAEAAPSTPPPKKKQKIPKFEMPSMMVGEVLEGMDF